VNTTRRPIDWEGVKKRLRESQLALERALVADPERIEAAYRRRAARLAGRQAQAGAVSAPLSVLVFSLGAERCALELTAIREVFPFSGCAPVPRAPEALLGVVNLRGEIRPMADLARLLDLPAGQEDAPGHVLLLRRGGQPVGLRVGRVEGVRQVSPGATPGEEGAGWHARYVRGVTPDMLRILDPEAILSHPIFRASNNKKNLTTEDTEGTGKTSFEF
jgi:chemotaxis signal transduction protein